MGSTRTVPRSYSQVAVPLGADRLPTQPGRDDPPPDFLSPFTCTPAALQHQVPLGRLLDICCLLPSRFPFHCPVSAVYGTARPSMNPWPGAQPLTLCGCRSPGACSRVFAICWIQGCLRLVKTQAPDLSTAWLGRADWFSLGFIYTGAGGAIPSSGRCTWASSDGAAVLRTAA